MTCLEKLKQDHPDWDECKINQIVSDDCPTSYFNIDTPKDSDGIQECHKYNCRACWNREAPETEAPRIKDSGERLEFTTGAVRDIHEGKGRCDLMPLGVVCKYFDKPIFGYLGMFQQNPKEEYLFECLRLFSSYYGEKTDITTDCTMFLEIAKHFEDGAKKYGENNWQKGIPVRCYIDSAVRHYLKFLRGDKDEPHDRAFCWNILCAIWTCKNKPELNEYGRTGEF